MVSRSQIELLDLFLDDRSFSVDQSTKSLFVLRSISFILGDQASLIEHCLEMVDDPLNMIREIRTEATERCFWKVPSSTKGRDYLCLRSFCPCRSYYEQSKTANGVVMCKHLAAIRIATALGRVQITTVPDNLFVQMMSDAEREAVPLPSRISTFL
jgi:predicted nucleic acid-binding Zn finger protein